MNKSIKKLITYLCKYFNYNVIQLQSSKNHYFWAAKNDENKKVFVFTEDINTEDLEDAISMYFQNNEDKQNNKFIKVLVVKNAANIFNFGENDVVIDSNKKEVIFTSEEIKDYIEEINRCLNILKSEGDIKNFPLVTISIIFINIIVFLFSAFLSNNFINIDPNVLINMGANYNVLVNKGQIYRLFTAMFLHAGIIHITLNMYALYNVGPLVERFYGKLKYSIIYIASGLVASTFSYFFSGSVSIGASGAIFGVLGAVLVFAIKMKNRIGKAFLKNIIVVIIINGFISVTVPNIDIYAHLGGLLFGIIISWLMFFYITN